MQGVESVRRDRWSGGKRALASGMQGGGVRCTCVYAGRALSCSRTASHADGATDPGGGLSLINSGTGIGWLTDLMGIGM
jgi:hypothetical protein